MQALLRKLENARCDLFKADIYPLGLTFYAIATGKDIAGLNQSPQNEEIIVEEIEKLNYPLCVKQTITHMLAYDNRKRIPTYSLYMCLRDI